MFSWTNRLSTHFVEGDVHVENTQFPIRYQVLDSIPESVVIGLFEVRRPVGGGFSNVKGTVTVDDVERNPPVVEVDIV